MRSKPTRARLTASATPKLPDQEKDPGFIDGTQELLQRTAHMSAEIELAARKLHGLYLSLGQRHDFEDLLDHARLQALYALDKHPLDLPERYQRFGNPDAEPRKRLFNIDLEHDVEYVAKELQIKWERPGIRYNLARITEHVRKEALNLLNTHPDDVHEAYRVLSNPKVSPKPQYTDYVLARNCVGVKIQIRLAPDGTDFTPVRTLVIADPLRGWSRVRALAVPGATVASGGRSVETQAPLTASSDKELLKAAAAMGLRVSRNKWLLSTK